MRKITYYSIKTLSGNLVLSVFTLIMLFSSVSAQEKGAFSIQVPIGGFFTGKYNFELSNGIKSEETIKTSGFNLFGSGPSEVSFSKSNISALNYGAVTYFITDNIDLGIALHYDKKEFDTNQNDTSTITNLNYGLVGRYTLGTGLAVGNSELRPYLRTAALYTQMNQEFSEEVTPGVLYDHRFRGYTIIPEIGVKYMFNDFVGLNLGGQYVYSSTSADNAIDGTETFDIDQEMAAIAATLKLEAVLFNPNGRTYKKKKRAEEEVEEIVAEEEVPEETPELEEGLLKKDTDKDGIIDQLDVCPLVPGTLKNDGCPSNISNETKKDLNEISRNTGSIYFPTNSAKIDVVNGIIVDGIAELIESNENLKFIVRGHTDNVGNDTFNQQLSERRAKSVMEYLIKNGISRDRLSAQGLGETDPVSENDTEKGRARNRRVEVLLLK